MRCVALTLAIFLVSGCSFKGEEFRQRRDAGGWPLRPASMRFHPFTQIKRTDAGLRIDARIEFSDPAGDVCKGVGELRFELYAESDSASRQGSEQRLLQWNATITRIEDNSVHWDPVTRTYLFPLTLDSALPGHPRLQLRAQYDASTGERLLAQTPIDLPE